MKAVKAVLLLAVLTLASPILAQSHDTVEFEPKVGTVGSRLILKTPPPPGAEVRFGGRKVIVFHEEGVTGILVPPGYGNSFVEFVRGDKVIAKSAVPFVVSGASVPKPLIGLKEAIDVFGYADARPEGGQKPEQPARPVLKFGDEEVLTIGEAPPLRLGPAVDLGDAASLGRRDMGSSLFLITARPPKKKVPAPTPTTGN